VSLQGSLDTFALPDVLVLLASTKKTGELHVTGSRTPGGPRTADLQGLLWVTNGSLVGHDVAKAPDAATAVFELLRLQEGSFSFVSGTPDNPQPPLEIEPILGEAQAYLSEWRDIEQVVPSLSAWLCLAPEAPAAHVSMRAEQWRLIVAIGGGCEVSSLVDHLGQGELLGCRSIKELAEAGLLDVSTEPMPDTSLGTSSNGAQTEVPAADFDDSTSGFDTPDPPIEASGRPDFFGSHSAGSDDAGGSADSFASDVGSEATESVSAASDGGFGSSGSGFGSNRSVADDRGDVFGSSALHAAADEAALHAQPQPLPEDDVMRTITDFDSLVTVPSRAKRGGAPFSTPTDDPGDPRPALSSLGGQRADAAGDGPLPEPLARQLDALGVGPPPAVAPASAADEGEDGDGDEPLNRGLLLKFLSSVRN